MTVQPRSIDTVRMSTLLRKRVIDVPDRKLMISRLGGSDQEDDLTIPANCGGYGRIRHFRQQTSPDWPSNPLPIIPACKALRLGPPPVMTAQVFQNAACAWRCWYCFVPYNLLSADPKRSAWLTAEELVNLYRAETNRPLIIDLSGGSPDLVPEWTPWMMEALIAAGFDRQTYLWTDDNLSTNYLFEKLTSDQLALLRAYPNYGRVCCFKGFDARSFAFNTRASEADFNVQFEVMRRLLETGIDLYGYITLTAPAADAIDSAMPRFFDRLQSLDPNLPLRVVPLEIREFSPVTPRMDEARQLSLHAQKQAIAAWNAEIETRFSPNLRALDIASVPIAGRSAIQ